jgi:hypothetical protein
MNIHDMELAAAFHALPEHEAGAAHFNHFGADRKQVVEPRRQVIFHMDLVHQDQYPVALDELRQVDARRVQQLAAGALHEREVLRMEDYAARVGILVIHTDRNFQASESRSLTALGATMPKCR